MLVAAHDPARLDSALLGGGRVGLQSLAGVATASEVASCDKPRLRQAIAAMRANEIGGKPGVFFKGWVKLGAALELTAATKAEGARRAFSGPRRDEFADDFSRMPSRQQLDEQMRIDACASG